MVRPHGVEQPDRDGAGDGGGGGRGRSGKKRKRKPEEKLEPDPDNPAEVLKFELAEELGLLDKVRKVGWGGLTAAESGRLGGLLTRRLKEAGLLPAEPGTGRVSSAGGKT